MWQTLALSTISGIWLLLAVGTTPFRAPVNWPQIQCDGCTAHAEISYTQPVSSTVPVSSTATTQPVTYSDLLDVHKEVLETSQNVTNWLLGILAASGVMAVFGGGFLLYRNFKNFDEVRTLSDDAKQKMLDMTLQIDTFKREIEARIQQADDLSQALDRLRKQSDEQAKAVDDIRKQIKTAQREIQLRIPRLETLAAIDTYAMKLFSADRVERQNARSKLLQYILDDDPVVRRECVRVFGAMPEYPEIFDLQDRGILDHLREMARTDKERGVQLEARSALKNFGIDLNPEELAA